MSPNMSRLECVLHLPCSHLLPKFDKKFMTKLCICEPEPVAKCRIGFGPSGLIPSNFACFCAVFFCIHTMQSLELKRS